MIRVPAVALVLAGSVLTPLPGAAGARVVPVKAFLCDSAEHAMQFADVMAKGENDEIATDRVGRAAGAMVCGRYVGMAAVESERVQLSSGTAYKLTAYRFQEDHRLAWLAELTFAPVSGGWDL